MVTSRASNARSRRGAEGLRVKIRRRLESKLRAGGDGRRPRITLIEMGFFVLVVLTTWVIASVSARWVPVYVGLLVTIFVVPRRRRLLSSASERDAACDAADAAEHESGLRVDCANGADQLRPLSRSDSDLTSSEWAESSDAIPDPTAASTPKPRRSRARARKAAQATETVTDSVPVVWIQTGPGKFVRVEGGVRAARSAEIESVFTRAIRQRTCPRRQYRRYRHSLNYRRNKNRPSRRGHSQARWNRLVFGMTVPRDQLLKSMVSHPLPSVWLRSSTPRLNNLMAIGRGKFSNPR